MDHHDMELAQLILQLQANLAANIERARQDVLSDLAELKAAQIIANGRTTKLELAQAAFEVRVRSLTRDGSLVGLFTRRQKVKWAGLGLLVVSVITEGIQRLVPVMISLLVKAAQGVTP